MFFLIKYLIRLWRRRQGAAGPTGDSARTSDDDAGREADEPGDRHVRRMATARAAAASVSRRSPAAQGPLVLLAHQVRYDVIASLRNPRARFFTFFFPIVLLVVFNGVFGSGHALVDGVRVTLSRFYVPGILAMSLVVASYANLVVSVSAARESGILKRRRATPAPPALLIAGQALSTVVIAAVMATLLLVISRLLYGVGFAPGAIAGIAVTAVVGTIVFACVGYAVSGLIGSPDSAQPVVQATMLPLWFVSGVFIPTSKLSPALRFVGELFPVEHLANSLHVASVHSSFATAISPKDLLVLALWGVGAAALAAWRFSWLPSVATA
jgi:ABC-2 type transport system permease protein